MEKVAEGFKGEKAIVTPYNIRNLQRENNITKQLFVSHIGYYPHAENHFRERESAIPNLLFRLMMCSIILTGSGTVV